MLGLFLDIETTGLDPIQHLPIDIAIAIVDLTQQQLLETYQSLIAIDRASWEKSDPASIAFNGYTFDELQTGKQRSQIGLEIIALFGRYGVARKKSLFICQNPTFDRSFFSLIVDLYTQNQFNWPYHWLDLASMYWTERNRLWKQDGKPVPETFSVSKDDIAAYYGVPPEAKPHKAHNGVKHLLHCYEAVIGSPISVKSMKPTL